QHPVSRSNSAPSTHCSAHHSYLHSFPTRRSSDLLVPRAEKRPSCRAARSSKAGASLCMKKIRLKIKLWASKIKSWRRFRGAGTRSEEHTSELQSLRHLVCRLLLEKKNQRYRHSRE